MMNNICEINRIAPFQGLNCWGDSFRRAMPYAIDNKAFSLKQELITAVRCFLTYFLLLMFP